MRIIKGKSITIVLLSVVFLFQSLFLGSCKKETPKQLPTVTVTEVKDITSVSAVAGGEVLSDGGAEVKSRGVCWSPTNVNPTIADSKTSDGTGLGVFNSSIEGLMPGTVYYLRAYATNVAGTAYYSQASFKTIAIAPLLTTTDFSLITANTFNSGGVITNDGGSPITARGICWDIFPNPTLSNNHTSDGTGIGSFISSVTGLSPVILYYFRAYATNSIGTAYGNPLSVKTLAGLSIVTTKTVTSIGSTSAVSGGIITSDGGVPILASGVCWSTANDPTINDNKTNEGTQSLSFSSSITGLVKETKYYVRAFATNSVGTAYGSTNSFTTTNGSTDVDGNVYNTITIGTQVWMDEYLKTTKYRNGDPIPNITNNVDWGMLRTGAYCVYNNDAALGNKYGKLYNWYAVNDSRNIAPVGWHVPTDSELLTLNNYVTANPGYSEFAAKALASKTDWLASSVVGAVGNDLSKNNSSEFSALPSGYRYDYGEFGWIGKVSYWWSSNEDYSSNAFYRGITSVEGSVHYYSISKGYGFSVRCIKD